MANIENVDIKPQDRIAQAGILLVEQAGMSLLSDAYKFPEQTRGHIDSVGADGTLQMSGSVNETIKSTLVAKHEEHGSYMGLWNHTEIKDQRGNTQTVDQVMGGDLLVVLTNNRLANHIDFKDSNGQLQYQMEGQTQFTPKDGVINDSSSTISDADGNYLGEMHIVAKPSAKQRNGLEITATFKYHDTYLGDVGAFMILDPDKQYRSADFQLVQRYDPPPPPPPPAQTPTPGTAK